MQELLEKSRLLPPEIRWHFIGGLQSNKCVALARDVRGLWAVESVDSEKKASLLDKGWGERFATAQTETRTKTKTVADGSRAGGAEEGGEREDVNMEGVKAKDEGKETQQDVEEADSVRLRVFVQVNTSGEENKAGVAPGAAPALCLFIREQCPRLKLQGLMTIGAIARSKATTPENENEDFLCLRGTRDRVIAELGLQDADAELDLSMGMSEDFEGAIALGSDEVRVGTTIFGERPPRAQAKAV